MLIQTVAAAIIIGYLRGGKLTGLSNLTFRGLWLIIIAFSLQAVVSFTGTKQVHLGPTWFVPSLHILSYLFLIGFTLANLRWSGFKVVTLGILLNFLVIAFNHGQMPVDATFLDLQQKQMLITGLGTHGLLTAKSTLIWLADRFFIWAPGWEGALINQVFSIGDVLIDLGVFLLIIDRMGRTGTYRYSSFN